VEQEWGIRVSKLALGEGGKVIGLEYEVVNPEKLTPLGNGTNVAYLVDRATGAEFQLTAAPEEQARPGTTRGRSMARALRLAGEFPPPAGRLVAGRTYSALIANRSGAVKTGSKMSLVVGSSRVDGLVVE
jgi:hypothetical protein